MARSRKCRDAAQDATRRSLLKIIQSLKNADLVEVRIDDLKLAALLVALDHCDGNRTQAAELLGISVRTLQRNLRDVPEGIDIPDPA